MSYPSARLKKCYQEDRVVERVERRRRLGSILSALAVVGVTLSGCGSPAGPEDRRPVTSLLEIRQHDVVIQKWDLSCGAAALGILLRYEWGDPATERDIALSLMKRKEYLENPDLVRIREGFSLLDLKRFVEARGYKGIGLGDLDLDDLMKNAPIMVPVNAFGYNHFVVFRGIHGNRVLLADPAWGNRTMTVEKFQHMWLDYGKPIGKVGFVVHRTKPDRQRANARPLQVQQVQVVPTLNKLKPRLEDFVTLG